MYINYKWMIIIYFQPFIKFKLITSKLDVKSLLVLMVSIGFLFYFRCTESNIINTSTFVIS